MISPVELLKIKIEKQRQQDMRNFLASQAINKSAAINKLRQEYREHHIDRDLDGISDAEEYSIGTNPHSADSDWDGHGDLEEISSKLDPRIYDGDDCEDLERQRELQ